MPSENRLSAGAKHRPRRPRSTPPQMGHRRGRKRSRAHADVGDAAGDGEEQALFPIGTEVEVRSDDDGFVGSFYEATVEGYLPNRRGYVVAYATLVTTPREEDGMCSPHRENVAAADVRPRPPWTPASHQPQQEFALYEMVEAFHNEGWWAGVVCRVLPAPGAPEGDQTPQQRVYSVCFPTTREVLDFDETRLRPRLVFLDGRWVTAAEAENRSPMFTLGSQVEVSRSREVFGEYWSPANILKVIDATSFVVCYENVGEDGEHFTEIMDAQYIRPGRDNITMDSKYRFPPSSSVEVFNEGSWWPGVILNVLDDKCMKKYVVKIKSHERDVLTVEHTKLRPRYDWSGRKWVRSSPEKQFNRGSQLKSAKRPISFTVKSSNDNDSGPSTMEKSNNADETLAAVCPDLSICSNTVQIKEKPSSYPGGTVKQPNTVLELRLPCQNSLSYIGKSSELQAFLFGAFGQQRCLLQGPVLGIQSFNQNFSSIGGTKDAFSVLGKKKQLTDKGYCLMDESEQNINPRLSVGTTAQYRKRKECISSQTPEEPGENLAEIVRTKKRIVDKNAEFCKVARNDHRQHEDIIDGIVQSNTSCVVPIDNLSNMAVAMPSDIMPHPFPLSENCEANKKVDKGVADCHGNKMELPSIMLETQHISTDGQFSGDEQVPRSDIDIPLLDFDAECSPSTDKSALTQVSSADGGNCTESEHGNKLFEPKDVEGTPMSSYVRHRTEGSCNPLLQRSLDVQKSILADKHSESLGADNLPFVKTSPLWAEFEAMEIFRKMPQRPHFHQFQHYVREVREGIALGLMHSFAYLGESIMQLNIEDDSSLFEEKMKGISSLEAHGFDVRHLRSHLGTLLHLKNGHVELQDANKKLQEKIAHEKTVDRQLGAKIGMLNSIIRELDLQAYLLRCTMQSFISEKVNCAVEISRLKVEARELKHLYLSAEKRFAEAVAALW